MQRPAPERLPEPVYSAAQVRALDRLAIERYGIAGYELMERAGRAALASLLEHWPHARQIAIFCGAGNNAGDGYVLARLAQATAIGVRVFAVGDPERLHGDAARAWRSWSACCGKVETELPRAAEADVIVDALLGTGLDRPVAGSYADAVELINRSGLPVLSLDIPSGLDADTGAVHGVAVHATLTITFVGLKQGLFLGLGPDHRGHLEFSALAIPSAAEAGMRAPLRRLTMERLATVLPRRPRTAHKGTSGRLLLVGGAPGTAGAIRLAAEAALRVGAGLVSVATHPESVSVVMAGRPEIMARSVDNARALQALLTKADAIVIGPGLGTGEWARELWACAREQALPIVVDADGLNLLAADPYVRNRWVLTPHPGEAGRLLGKTSEQVQSDRSGSALALAAGYGAIAVLKGSGTLVAAPDDEQLVVCERGNPGMASGGTGDVLAGVVGGLLVQCRNPRWAAEAGVLLHALAGDTAVLPGERGTLASDLLTQLRPWANPS